MPDGARPAMVEFPTEDIEQSVAARFQRQVEQSADHPAVLTARGALSYRRLNIAANRVAHAILAACGAAPDPVAVLFAHGDTAVVASLAVLKAGKILVPLDASDPRSRVRGLLAHSQARCLLTDAAQHSLAGDAAAGALPVVDIGAIGEASDENPDLPIAPDALAYVLYTSGSTGRPKGVVWTHRAALHSALTYGDAMGLSPADRMLLLYGYNTSAGIRGILAALLRGAAVVPFDVRARGLSALGEVLAQDGITVYSSTPTAFRALAHSIRRPVRFPSLRLIAQTSEPAFRSDVALYRALTPPDCRFLNSLGSSEASFCRQYFVTHRTPIEQPLLPVGYPVPGKSILLLDESGHEVSPGEVGEIVVQSRYLALGYWRDPELTRERFSPAPDGSGAQRYRMGDLGRMLPDGCLVCLGRKDAQLKIRGFRVEPAEVEGALREHPGIRDAAVAGRAHPTTGEIRLVGYTVPRDAAPDGADLREFLAARLPAYMVPAAFVRLESLPLLPGGKVDRRALPEPRWDGSRGREAAALPVGSAARRVAEVWQQVLGVGPIGLRDDFFDLGGDSLGAARILNKIEQIWGIRLPLSVFLQNTTVEQLAALLPASRRAGSV
jgi:amino acid adenylation domain-containing protein